MCFCVPSRTVFQTCIFLVICSEPENRPCVGKNRPSVGKNRPFVVLCFLQNNDFELLRLQNISFSHTLNVVSWEIGPIIFHQLVQVQTLSSGLHLLSLYCNCLSEMSTRMESRAWSCSTLVLGSSLVDEQNSALNNKEEADIQDTILDESAADYEGQIQDLEVHRCTLYAFQSI